MFASNVLAKFVLLMRNCRLKCLTFQYLGFFEVFLNEIIPARNHVTNRVGDGQIPRIDEQGGSGELVIPFRGPARPELVAKLACTGVTNLGPLDQIKGGCDQSSPGLSIRRDTLLGNNGVAEQKCLPTKANHAKAYHAELASAQTVETVPGNSNSPSDIDAANHMKRSYAEW